MTGKVKLKEQKSELPRHSFEDLKVGEGLQSNHNDGTRIKVGHDHYLHFQKDGEVVCNAIGYWPYDEFMGKIIKFKLIAEEI